MEQRTRRARREVSNQVIITSLITFRRENPLLATV